jgi:hypothetical protein
MDLRTSLRPATVAAASLCAILAIAGAAQAVTDTVFKYTTPKIGFFTVDAMALAPDGSSNVAFFNDWDGGLAALTGNGACYNTGVNLPNGATITQFSVWAASGATGDPRSSLRRKKLSDGSFDILAQTLLADDTGTRKVQHIAVPAADAVVNNNLYSYGFGTCPGVGDTFYAARISDTYQNAGD